MTNDAPAASGGRGRELLFRLLLVVGALGLTFGLVEVALRVSDYDLNASPRWHYHPRFGWTISRDWTELDHVNALGFRFPATPETKPAGRKRLVVLGDSFAFGSGYDYAQTFPGLLDAWLGPGWDVINLGVGGWGTAQQLLAWREVGRRHEPDAVLLQVFPFNDVCNNAPELVFTCSLQDVHRPYWTPDDDGRLRPSPPPSLRRGHRLRRWSRLAGLLELRLAFGRFAIGPAASDPAAYQAWRVERRRSAMEAAGLKGKRAAGYMLVPKPHQPPAIAAAWRTTEALLGAVADEVRAEGLPLAAVVIPNVETMPPAWEKIRRQEPSEAVPDHATATIESILRGLDVPTISLRDRIEAQPARGLQPQDYFYPTHNNRDTHLNRLGHDRVARMALWHLRRAGVTDARPPAGDVLDFDAFATSVAPVAVRGLIPAAPGRPRTSFGARTTLAFAQEASHPMVLTFTVRPRADQEVELWINGKRQALAERGPQTIRFPSRPGRNVVAFRFANVAHDQSGAAVFSTLKLATDPSGGPTS